MKTVCLVENTEGTCGCAAEHGLSFYIETGTHKLLVDAGADDLILKNAAILHVDLAAVDTVILTHGHYDHGGGLPYFLSVNHTAKLYMQRSAFGPYYSMHHSGPKYIGLPEELRNQKQLVLLDGSEEIDSSLSLIADLPFEYPNPSANQRLKKKTEEDYIPDSFDHEQMLVIFEQGHRYLFSGCAHHGILNMLACFHKKYGCDPDAVFSGFHMMKKSGYSDADLSMITDTANHLKETASVFYTGHCTGTEPYEIMKRILGDQLHYMHCGDHVILNPQDTNSCSKTEHNPAQRKP